MSRAKWKGPNINLPLIQNIFLHEKKTKIWSRNSVIPSILINKQVLVYNGKIFKPVFITREKVGFKFGEFSFTRSKGKKKVTRNAKLTKKPNK